MSTIARSSVLLMAWLCLPATASAQSPAGPPVDPELPVTELLIHDPRWVPAVHGAVPASAVAHGRERDGSPQYICRTYFESGTHLGKVSSGSGGCVIVAAGRAVVRRSYEVLTETVTPGSSDTAPIESARRPNRWGRSESVLEIMRRNRAARSGAKE
jgi:hypothetical protein